MAKEETQGNSHSYSTLSEEQLIYRSDKSFKEYWKNFIIWKYFSYVFSFLIFIFIIGKLIFAWDNVNDSRTLLRIFISTLILTLQPFITSKRFRQTLLTLSGVVLIIAVINLEQAFGRRHCFLTLYLMIITYRILQTRTFYDNFALCISFSADVSPLGHGNANWYITCNLFLWTYFWTAWVLQNAFKRNSLRIWEHLKVLIILKGKLKNEIEKRDALVSAHFNNDLLQFLFPSASDDDHQGNDNTTTNNNSQFTTTAVNTKNESTMTPQSFFVKKEHHEYDFQDQNQQSPPLFTPRMDSSVNPKDQRNEYDFLQTAIADDLVSVFETGKITPENLKQLNGLEKRNSAIIAVKIDRGEADECAFIVDREQNIHQMMDRLAVKYNIKSIRRFGNVWIGLRGFFNEIGKKPKAAAQSTTAPVPEKIAENPVKPVPSVQNLADRTVSTMEVPQTPATIAAPSHKSPAIPPIMRDGGDDMRIIPNKDPRLVAKDSSMSIDKPFNSTNNNNNEGSSNRMENLNNSNSNHKVNELDSSVNIHPNEPERKNSRVKNNLPSKKEKSGVHDSTINPNNKENKPSPENNESLEDCFNALLFCAELQYILNYCGIKIAAAVDYGPVLGGFIASPHFDIFGQEIRWVLKTLDLNEYSRVLVSDFIRDQFNNQRSGSAEKNIVYPEFQRTPIEFPWKRENFITLPYLSNGERMLGEGLIGKHLLIQYSCLSLDELSEKLLNSSWFTYFEGSNKLFQGKKLNRYYYREKELEKENSTQSNDPNANENNVSNGNTNTNPTPSTGNNGNNDRTKPNKMKSWWVHMLSSYFEIFYWYEDLGPEFKHSFQERWQIDLDDPVIQKYSEKELAKLMEELEAKLYHLVFTACFPTWFHKLLFRNKYKHGLHPLPKGKPVASGAVDSPKYSQQGATNVHGNTTSNGTNMTNGEYDVQFAPPNFLGSSLSTASRFLPFLSRLLPEGSARIGITGENSDEYQSQSALKPPPNQTVSRGKKSTTSFYDLYYRGPFDYLHESRLFSHINFINLGVELGVMVCAWYPLLAIFNLSEFTWAEVFFVNFYILHCLVSRQLDKSFEFQGSLLLIVIILAIFASFPCYLVRELREDGNGQFGDWGGDSALMLIFSLRFSNNMKQLPWGAVSEGMVLRFIFLAVRNYSNDCYMPYPATLTTLVLCGIYGLFYYFLTYRAYMSYILEHHLVYYTAKQYEKQKQSTTEFFCVFNPQLHDDPSSLYNFRQLYRNSAIAVVHLKLADFGSTLIEPRDFLRLVTALEKNINKIFSDFGVVRMTNFTGLFVAVVSKNVGQDGLLRRSNISHNLHVLYLLKRVQTAIERFSIDHNFNVSVGVSVNSGNLYIGFLGNDKYCFDASGFARDIAITMASHNNENSMFISREFEPLIPSIIPNPEAVHRQFMKDERYGLYWLRFDGAVSGMQLQDFTYMGMLGKGGYGSVHLVTEKYTNEKFAVKVIVLKNSVMSRMIKRECIILQKMQHPNIVRFQYSFLTNNRLYLVMKYITGGNLKQVIERDSPSLLQLRIWFAELVLAVEYIHNVGIIHRDIKPANCMIGSTGQLQLADFGLSKSMPKHNKLNANNAVPQAGTNLLSMNGDVHDKLKRFFPLKSHLTGSVSGMTSVSALVISSLQTDALDKMEKPFTNFMINVISTNKVGAVAILPTMNVDSVFIEMNPDDNVQDILEILKDIRNISRNTTPVYICFSKMTTHYLQHKRKFLEFGAIDCFEKLFNNLEEDTLAGIYNIISYDYHKNTIYQIENSASNKLYPFNSTPSIFSTTMNNPMSRSASANLSKGNNSNGSNSEVGSRRSSFSSTATPTSGVTGEDPLLLLQQQHSSSSNPSDPSIPMGISPPVIAPSSNQPPGNNTNQTPPVTAIVTPAGEALILQNNNSPQVSNYSSPNNVENGALAAPILSNSPVAHNQVAGNLSNFRFSNASSSVSTNSLAQVFTVDYTSHTNNNHSTAPASNPPARAIPTNTNTETTTATGFNAAAANQTNNNNTSKSHKPGNLTESDDKDHIVGTIHFIAPEILKNHNYSDASDWWAVAITFYFSITRKHLFGGEDRHTIFDNIKYSDISLSALDPYDVANPPGIKSLLTGMLDRNIHNRAAFMGTIRQQQFFQGLPFDALPGYNTNRFMPPTFMPKKFNVADKATFYGDPTASTTNNNGKDKANNNNNNNPTDPNNPNNNANADGANGNDNNANNNENSMSGSLLSQNTELSKKISYNKMRMEMRNDYLINRFKKNKKRLSDYRKRRIHHISIKYQKKLKQEKENNENNPFLNQSLTSPRDGSNSSNSGGFRRYKYRPQEEQEAFVYPSYSSYSKHLNNKNGTAVGNNGADGEGVTGNDGSDPSNTDHPSHANNFYPNAPESNVADNYYYDMDYYYTNNYYTSKQNAQLQYISQQQTFSESKSFSGDNSDSSFYSDKTIREEENEDENDESDSSSHHNQKSASAMTAVNNKTTTANNSGGHVINRSRHHSGSHSHSLSHSNSNSSKKRSANGGNRSRSIGQSRNSREDSTKVREFVSMEDDASAIDDPLLMYARGGGRRLHRNHSNSHHGDDEDGDDEIYNDYSIEEHEEMENYINFLEREEERKQKLREEMEKSIQKEEIENDKSMSIPIEN